MSNASEVFKFIEGKMAVEPEKVNTKTKETRRFLDTSLVMMAEISDPELVAVLRGFKSTQKTHKLTMPKDAHRVLLSAEYVKEIVDIISKVGQGGIAITVAKGKLVKFEVPNRMAFYLACRSETEAAKAAVVTKEEQAKDKEAKEDLAEPKDERD